MKMNNLNIGKFRLNRGFSLISMMIAMVIGLFIIGAGGQVYVQSKSSFNARAAVSAVSENGRFAVQDIRRVLGMAGMNITASEEFNSSLRAIPPLDAGTGTFYGGANSDIVAVRYRRGPTCDGYVNLGLSSAPVTVRFSVINDQLMCQVTGKAAKPLVAGVKMMKVLYGVDNPVPSDADGYANRYLTAEQVNALSLWRSIVSIRVGLVVDSAEQSQPLAMRSKTAETLSVLGMDYAVPANDEKLYKVFTTTVQMRNLNAIMQKQ